MIYRDSDSWLIELLVEGSHFFFAYLSEAWVILSQSIRHRLSKQFPARGVEAKATVEARAGKKDVEKLGPSSALVGYRISTAGKKMQTQAWKYVIGVSMTKSQSCQKSLDCNNKWYGIRGVWLQSNSESSFSILIGHMERPEISRWQWELGP